MLDNGAFSLWRAAQQARRPLEVDWSEWAKWADPWLDRPTTWAVLPDSITGGEEENDRLLDEWGETFGQQGVPVWHLHEPLERLSQLIDRFGRVCFGSSGAYAVVGSAEWHRRVSAAFDAISDDRGRVPWVHMLRGMAVAGDYPFASVDSTDIARNHNRPQNTALGMAERWDAIQGPARWERRGEQLALAASSAD